jgi:antitoxin component of MazEF toxin-antitoxin module
MRQTVRYENGNLIGLPEEVIERLSLKSGDELEVVVNSSDHVILTPVRMKTNEREKLFAAWKRTGLLRDGGIPAATSEPAWKQLPPITVNGEPLSETIIHDRDSDD